MFASLKVNDSKKLASFPHESFSSLRQGFPKPHLRGAPSIYDPLERRRVIFRRRLEVLLPSLTTRIIAQIFFRAYRAATRKSPRFRMLRRSSTWSYRTWLPRVTSPAGIQFSFQKTCYLDFCPRIGKQKSEWFSSCRILCCDYSHNFPQTDRPLLTPCLRSTNDKVDPSPSTPIF
jgi:hypothetical protein